MTELTGEIAPGTILAGKYRVDRVLGAGGMGMVVAAHHLQLDERVAIKMLLPSMLEHPEAVERFAREARAAVKIKSEHVARVSDVGKLESGAPFMVMEFLEGEDLADRVARLGSLPVEQAVEFVLQACEALAEAHALGIVHRDLKPANLFCVRRADGLDSVKVLDFGISKASTMSGSGDFSMTKTSTMMGSPYYMSPEQMISAKSADVQSDIWSMGAVLFQLLTGRVPFEAETLPELVVRVTSGKGPDWTDLPASVPEGLRTVVKHCLERDKALRYPNTAELAVALCPFGPPKRAIASAERTVRVLTNAGLANTKLPSSAPKRESRATRDHDDDVSQVRAETLAAFGATTPPLRRTNRGLLYGVLGVGLVATLGLIFAFESDEPEAAALPEDEGPAPLTTESPTDTMAPAGPAPDATPPPPRIEEEAAEGLQPGSESSNVPAPSTPPSPRPSSQKPPAPAPATQPPAPAPAPAPAPVPQPAPKPPAPKPAPAPAPSLRTDFGGRL